jgi:hypothetical protein
MSLSIQAPSRVIASSVVALVRSEIRSAASRTSEGDRIRAAVSEV